jgi:hypothetical protein
MFHDTMEVIANAADSDADKGKECLPAIYAAQKSGDENELAEAWEKWYQKVPSALKVKENREKHKDEINKREKAIGVVMDKNPKDNPELLRKVEKACQRIQDLYLEGFIAMPNNTWSYLGEGYVF